MLKLRTMVAGAESIGSGLAVNEGDPRITRVGALLRRFSIDELPNLVNVLRGDMAIIGPRPTIPVQVEQYTERQRGRLALRPGITGWAQVNGRTSLPWSERIELDLWYVEHRSWRLDLEILAQTVRIVLGGKGVYKGWTGGMGRQAVTAILLTGVGKRYDIVSAFAQHATVIAADPNPLAPAQYAAHHRVAVPLSATRLHPGAARAVRRARRRRGRPAHRPRHRGARAGARGRARCPRRSSPAPETARATYDKYEAHLLLERLGLPSPPTVLPGESRDVVPGDGQAAPRLGRRRRSTAPPTPSRPSSSSATSATRTRWSSASCRARSSRWTA